ncbi:MULTISPECIES: ExbD/TolR family protein [Psychrobacter]|uniref:Outer membrane transport energization protein ExbD n=1 Tax=Psychrobacter cryohalolentis (strain ATCC BAA-1226 / DSM 17306 / VKM B-2378 / K5) TaxID=335284 RepID=Q1Q9H2_PSYCK|nr:MULTISPECIES: biopolymer transporter ExbD [Psychrobacter]ABE75681.1 outer membrane transport energization protein ExbD [Psychrobacter cryohalolentis K5]AGP49555.1 biopolymer transporter [Psychrobacter sp. G]ASE25871.1 biopolymer transporter ExbD [Psychrobacter cryohalolentis]KAA0938413.1 biopolymer transporter ExbD [Psychrobacter sp. ANT_H59]MBA2057071.1 biopolymer transporter ExbD [Psychrobacter sp. D2]|tara:strand:+ start:814 stop:1215 length:402 start_codon:yes stop_codon:yes gene_type:complete
MAFQLGDDSSQSMNEMNLIPLIDIMLVLMIIFLLTASVLNPAVPLDLPKTSAMLNEIPPEAIQISIDKDAGIFWDSDPISMEELEVRLQQQSAAGKDPSVQLRADKDSKYDTVAQVLAAASEAGLSKIAFVNE